MNDNVCSYEKLKSRGQPVIISPRRRQSLQVEKELRRLPHDVAFGRKLDPSTFLNKRCDNYLIYYEVCSLFPF